MSLSEHRHAVLMGVCGCGKSSVGARLSERTGLPYVDGDDLHPERNVALMRAGLPLSDAERWPWLDACADRLAKAPEGLLLGCSALRRRYRDRLRERSGHKGLLFIHLTGSPALVAERLAGRKGHYMPGSLLQSQLDALEAPGADETALTVDIARPVPDLVDTILSVAA